MQVSDKLIELLAKLSKLQLSDKERELYAAQLKEIIKYISKIKSFDTKGAKPVYHTNISELAPREDKQENARMLSKKKALANAKRVQDDQFVVDAIL